MFDRILFDKTKLDKETTPSTLDNMSIGMFSLPSEVITDERVLPLLPATSIISMDDNGGGIIEGNPSIGLYTLYLVIKPIIDMRSAGIFKLTRMGSTITDIIELDNITLANGESITIDTDLMIVLFGLIHDVSSMTDASVFFELDDGKNDIYFTWEYAAVPNPMPANQLDVTVIWQNRWL